MKMTEVAVARVQDEGAYNNNGSLVSSTSSSSSSTSSTSSCNCDCYTRISKMENELRKVSAQSHTQKLWLKHLCDLLTDKLGLDIQVTKNIGSLSDDVDSTEAGIENDVNKTEASSSGTAVSSSTLALHSNSFAGVATLKNDNISTTSTTGMTELFGSVKNNVSVPTQSSISNSISTFPLVNNKMTMSHKDDIEKQQPQQQQKQETNLNQMKTVFVYQNNNDKRKFPYPGELTANKIEKKDSTVIISMSKSLTTSTNADPGLHLSTPQLEAKSIQPQTFTCNPNFNFNKFIRLADGHPSVPGKQVYLMINPNSSPSIDTSKFFTNSTLSKENGGSTTTTGSHVTLDVSPVVLPTELVNSFVPTVEVTIDKKTSPTATMNSSTDISTEFSAAEIPIKMEVEIDQGEEVIGENNDGNNAMDNQISLAPFNDTNDQNGDENTDGIFADSMFEDEDDDDGIYPDYPLDDYPMTMTTAAGDRVLIVHENDPNVDIKYDPFGDMGIPVENESQDDEHDVGPANAQSVQRSSVPRSLFEQTVEALHLSNRSGFNWMWLLDMKKHQSGLMPYPMLLKRDDIRQWFEYVFDKAQPALSRYRCWICCKFIQIFKYPESSWGPMETEGAQLRSTIVENRNSINSHGRKKCHREILQKLSLPENKRLYPIPGIVRFDDAAKKQLAESLKTS